jgi:uncharacterized protein YeaO (DUF488 family)
MFTIKRIYEPAAASDGYRVLVDRLWPRGVRKETAALDLWLKDVAPSPALRTWFGHKPERYEEFTARYQDELASNPAVRTLRDLANEHAAVTLLYAAHDPDNNHAKVLLGYLQHSK